MRINYSDVQRGSDYHGTKIIILADDKVEAKAIDAILTNNRNKILNDLAYDYERKGLVFSMVGYDGFLASVVERMLTGQSLAWQHNEYRSPHRLEINHVTP